MATTVELECPGCQQMLAVDAGFVGGVCRCSNCGTLMTVPRDRAHHHAERLYRPETPGGGKAPRPEQPTTDISQSEPPVADQVPPANRPEVPKTANQKGPRVQGSKGPSSEGGDFEASGPRTHGRSSGGQVLVTDAGREVEVESESAIPTASRKRMVVRATTATLFVIVIGGLLAVAIVVGIMFLPRAQAPKPKPENIRKQQFDFNPAKNPWLMDAPNVLGMSLGEKTVVIVDSAAASKPWLAMVNQAVAAGMAGVNTGAKVNLLYNSEGAVQAYVSYLRPVAFLRESSLKQFTATMRAKGQPSLVPAIEAAVGYQPKQILLVTSRRPPLGQITQLEDLLGKQDDLLLDVIAIDQDIPQLRNLAEGTYGQYQPLDTKTIKRWREEASKQ